MTAAFSFNGRSQGWNKSSFFCFPLKFNGLFRERGLYDKKRTRAGGRRDTRTFVPNPPPCLRSTLHIQGRALGVAYSLLCCLSNHESCCGHVPVAFMVRALLSKGKCIFLPIPADVGENSHARSDQRLQSQGCCVWSLERGPRAGWCAWNVTTVKHLRCLHV